MNLNYIIDQVWPWGTGTGTETGAGQFNFSKYGVRTEYRMNLIVSSTDKVRTKSALKFWCGYGTGYGRIFKIEVQVRIAYPYLHSGVCSRLRIYEKNY